MFALLWLSVLLPWHCASSADGGESRFQDWLRKLDPKGITLAFASFHPSNPASSFGHLFLRVDQNNPLLDYAIGYSAEVTTTNPILYSINGIFGGFLGSYTTFPYHLKIVQYQDIDTRDIWEYPIIFSKEESVDLLRRAWRASQTKQRYYFFHRNCASEIARLVEPQLSLPLWVVPSDVLKALWQLGRLEAPIYRPSLKREIWNSLRALKRRDRDLLVKFAQGRGELSSDNIRSMDVGLKIAQFQGEPQEEFNLLLRKRAEAADSPSVVESIPDDKPPHDLPFSRQMRLGFAFDGKRSRLLTSNAIGARIWTRNLMLEILNGEVAWNLDRRKFVFPKLTVVNARSYASQEFVFSPRAWDLRFDWENGVGFQTRLGIGAFLERFGLLWHFAQRGLGFMPGLHLVFHMQDFYFELACQKNFENSNVACDVESQTEFLQPLYLEFKKSILDSGWKVQAGIKFELPGALKNENN